MREVKILNRQSVWDIVYQEYGHSDGLPQFLTDNPTLNLETPLVVGSTVKIDDTKIIDRTVVDSLRKKGQKLSTEYQGGDIAFSLGFSLGFKTQ